MKTDLKKQENMKDAPNIVWLVGDHYAFEHHREQFNLATYDRLGRERIVFEQAYSVCPNCQPARASMLTGKQGLLNKSSLAFHPLHRPITAIFQAAIFLFQS